MTYIYKLKINGKSYVGSTKNIKKRIVYHKGFLYNKTCRQYNFKLYKYIRENGGWENVIFHILQECNEDVRYIVEDFYIKHYNCELNSVGAILDLEKQKEYKKKYNMKYGKDYYQENKEELIDNAKEYYKNNKQKVLQYQKEYAEKNEEKIKARRKIKFTCVCGSTLLKIDKRRHERTIKHQDYLKSSSSSSSLPIK